MPSKKTDSLLYAQLIGILLTTLLMVVFYGLSDKELSIGNFTLNKIQIVPDSLSADSAKRQLPDTISVAPPQDTLRTDTISQRILFFGDSMVEGLSKRLRQYADRNGH